MQNTQAEVQRLQAKLRDIGHRRRQTRQPSTSSYLSVTDATLASNFAVGPMDAQRDAHPPRHLVSLPFGAPAPANVRPTSTVGPVVPGSKPSGIEPASGSLGRDRRRTTRFQSPQPAPRMFSELVRPVSAADDGVGRAVKAARGDSTNVPVAPTAVDKTVPGKLLPVPPASSATDAAQLADTLRYHRYPSASPHSPVAGIQTGPDYLLRFGKRLGRSLSYPLLRRPLGDSTTDISMPDDAPAEAPSGVTLQDAVLWIAASAAVRVGLDLLLVTYSGLWLPVVAVIVAPAAIAIYRTAVNPEAGFALGGRLLLIMVGLLLGGRVL